MTMHVIQRWPVPHSGHYVRSSFSWFPSDLNKWAFNRDTLFGSSLFNYESYSSVLTKITS
ncbi:unnamed protein product, partial [Nesidiocoris tenuis]